jgi:aspartokinase-like uncharacterized kinase
MSRPVVVKVGGSLFDLPDLGERLRRFLATLDGPILLYPGGGAAANAVRELDRVHQFGEEASHWLALRACAVNAHFLARLLGVPVVGKLTGSRCVIADPYAFARADEAMPDALPHSWEVTSDSLALRVAQRIGAGTLILLKSCDWPGGAWDEAAEAGVVDRCFATALRGAPTIAVRVVNLRAHVGQALA